MRFSDAARVAASLSARDMSYSFGWRFSPL
jgi:hypothetical protein